MSQFCENCGAPLPDDAKFCEACGAKVLPLGMAEGQGNAEGSGQQDYAPEPAQDIPPVSRPAYENKPSGPAFTENSGRPASAAPSGPSRPGGSFPKIALIGGAVALAAVVGVFALRGGKKEPGNEAESTTAQAETTIAADSTSGGAGSLSTDGSSGGLSASDTTGTVGTQGGLTAAEQAALLEQGMNAISGGVTTGDLSKIKVPDGAEIRTDAMLTDLIGDYKGEIQMTVIEGYEDIPNVPDNFPEIKKEALSTPRNCNLRIEEDGNWDIIFSLVGIMDFDSDDYDDPEEFTPAEIDAMMITTTSNGMYHAKIDKSFEDQGSGGGHVKMDHIGAYCVNGDDRMIAGNFALTMTMADAEIKVEGDFLVHKLTEDYLETQTEAYEQVPATQPEETKAEDISAVSSSSGSTAQSGSSGTTGSTSTDALGKKAEALAKKNEKNGSSPSAAGTNSGIPTVTGGKWIQIASVWFYEKDGDLVKNSWINDNGVYYYVDETGYMISNAYTPDGYYVGADGSYDPNAPQNKSGGATSSVAGTPTGDAMAAIAKKLSTDEPAYATEFDWFLDYVNETGYGNAQVITDPNRATRMTDLQEALNGGWKAFICTKKGVYGSDVERYLNANIDAAGGKFNITLNWKYLVEPNGETIEEKGSSVYRGTYDDLEGTATAMTDDSKIDFDAFYLSKDGQTEYAVGTFTWISGEKDSIALMRSAK